MTWVERTNGLRNLSKNVKNLNWRESPRSSHAFHILMSLLAITVLALGQKGNAESTITGYRPIVVPAITAPATFRGSRAEKRGVRDFAAINSAWLIAKPMNQVRAALSKELHREPVGNALAPMYIVDKPDRRVFLQLWEQMRFVRKGKDGKPVTVNDTVLSLTEEPYLEGPEPKNWPKAARRVPMGWSAPLAGLKLPDHWIAMAPPSGLPVYHLSWYVDQDLDTVANRVAKRLPGWSRSGNTFSSGGNLPPTSFKSHIYLVADKASPNAPRTRLVMTWLNPRELRPGSNSIK